MTIRDIVTFIDTKAPFAAAEEWDNVGLLVGDADAAVGRVLVTLDATDGALSAAEAMGADLILTHHPVIFAPLKRLDARSLPYRLAASGISLIAAHTNLDKAADGVNDTLVACLGLENVAPAADGMTRIGTLPQVTDAAAFAKQTATVLNTSVRVADGGVPLHTVAVCGGSGGDFLPDLVGKADAFVTGEVKHHQWLQAAAEGITLIEAGHYATEVPVVDTLCRWLQEAFPALTVTPYYDGDPYVTQK